MVGFFRVQPALSSDDLAHLGAPGTELGVIDAFDGFRYRIGGSGAATVLDQQAGLKVELFPVIVKNTAYVFRSDNFRLVDGLGC